MYAYITSNSPVKVFTISDHFVNDLRSIPGQTLSQAYFDSSEINNDRLVIAYNDEPPNKKSNSRKGHLKGVVVADERSGFWMVHSVPLYPNISSKLLTKFRFFIVLHLFIFSIIFPSFNK